MCATSASAALLGTGAPQKASPKRSPIPHPGGHRGPKGGDPTPGPRGQPWLGRDGQEPGRGDVSLPGGAALLGGGGDTGLLMGYQEERYGRCGGEKAPLMRYRGAGTAAGERDRAPLMGYREGRYRGRGSGREAAPLRDEGAGGGGSAGGGHREGPGGCGAAHRVTHSVILGSRLPIQRRCPSCRAPSERMEAFSSGSVWRPGSMALRGAAVRAGRGGGRGAGDGTGRGRTHHDTAGPRRPRPLPPRAGLAPPSAPLSDDVTPRRGPDDVSCNARGCATVSEAAGARPTPTRPPPLHRPRARSLVPGPAAQPGPPWGTGGARGQGGAGAS